MSADEAALLAAIAADPGSDHPRLVYADWLDDHGQGVRAEFVRVQCEVARLGARPEAADPLARRLWERQEALHAGHVRELFAGAECLLGRNPTFRRGFVAEATLDVRDFLPLAAELAVLLPPPEVRVRGFGGEVPGFFACPHLGCVTAAGMYDAWAHLRMDDGLVAAGLRRAAGRLTRLRVLDLSGGQLGDADWAELAAAPLPALRALDLSNCGLTDEAVSALLDGRLGRRLTKLVLDGNPLTDATAYDLIDRFALGQALPVLHLGRLELVSFTAQRALRAAAGDRCQFS